MKNLIFSLHIIQCYSHETLWRLNYLKYFNKQILQSYKLSFTCFVWLSYLFFFLQQECWNIWPCVGQMVIFTWHESLSRWCLWSDRFRKNLCDWWLWWIKVFEIYWLLSSRYQLMEYRRWITYSTLNLIVALMIYFY